MGACASVQQVPEEMSYIIGTWKGMNGMELSISQSGNVSFHYNLLGSSKTVTGPIIRYGVEKNIPDFEVRSFMFSRDLYRIEKLPETDAASGKINIRINGFVLIKEIATSAS